MEDFLEEAVAKNNPGGIDERILDTSLGQIMWCLEERLNIFLDSFQKKKAEEIKKKSEGFPEGKTNKNNLSFVARCTFAI